MTRTAHPGGSRSSDVTSSLTPIPLMTNFELPAGLAVIGVHGADQAGVEAARDVPELDRILRIDDRGADEGLLHRPQHVVASRGPMFHAVG